MLQPEEVRSHLEGIEAGCFKEILQVGGGGHKNSAVFDKRGSGLLFFDGRNKWRGRETEVLVAAGAGADCQ